MHAQLIMMVVVMIRSKVVFLCVLLFGMCFSWNFPLIPNFEELHLGGEDCSEYMHLSVLK